MRSRTVPLVVVVVVASVLMGCSGDSTESETSEPASTLPPETTATSAAPGTTVAATTTAAPEAASGVDEGLVPSFAAKVRDRWASAESMGGTAPDLSDDEIASIGASVCAYFVDHPLATHSTVSGEERMEAYTDVSVIIADALGLPYDPALQDAGFESRFDSRMITGFKYTLVPADNGGLCPVPVSGPGSMPCSEFGKECDLFSSPWSGAASPA